MPRTATKKVDDNNVQKVKKTAQKDDADKQKKRRRNGKANTRFVYEVKKGSKRESVVIQSQVKAMINEAAAHAMKKMVEAAKNINPEKTTIKPEQARCAAAYFVTGQCHDYAEHMPALGKLFDGVQTQLNADKEAEQAKEKAK
jgi:hypothetical protein